jgi:hypothetical protein
MTAIVVSAVAHSGSRRELLTCRNITVGPSLLVPPQLPTPVDVTPTTMVLKYLHFTCCVSRSRAVVVAVVAGGDRRSGGEFGVLGRQQPVQQRGRGSAHALRKQPK